MSWKLKYIMTRYCWLLVIFGLCLLGILMSTDDVQAYSLPMTGQTSCYSDTEQIACPNTGADYFGQDGYYQAGLPMTYAVEGTSSDMVQDVVTGLTWIRSPYGKDTYVNGAAYCDGLSLNGYDDWRVPSERELVTLIDIGREAPTWNAVFNGGYATAGYFSSNAYSGDTTQQIGVVFEYGNIIIHSATTSGYMRCTRGAALVSSFTTGAGTVTDLSTGLVWENPGSALEYTWKDALSYCEKLEAGGYTDWRLPNYHELLSIVDYTRNNPAINPSFSAYADSYWTSSTRYNHPNNGIYVDFNTGYASYYFSKTYTNYARCVRGGTTNVVVAVLAHTPSSPTTSRTATITVGGNGVVAYKYSLDGGDWSAAASVATPVSLAGLGVGTHRLSVVGENGNGVWQSMDTPTTATWTVVAGIVPTLLLLPGE